MRKGYLRLKAWMIENAYLVTLGCLMAIIVACAMYTNGIRNGLQEGVQAAAGAPETQTTTAPVKTAEVTPLPTIAPLGIRPSAMAQRGGAWPTQGSVIRAYDPQELVYWEVLDLWSAHTALDIAGEAGGTIVACEEGDVIYAQWDELWGWRVQIRQDEGKETTYAGLEGCIVTDGEHVMRGQTIGTLLERIPCEAELGTHLHLEMRSDGRYRDPEATLAER